jgi:hypothetical protein
MSFLQRSDAAATLQPRAGYSIRLDSAPGWSCFAGSARRLTPAARYCVAIRAHWQRDHVQLTNCGLVATGGQEWTLHAWRGRYRAPHCVPSGEPGAAGSKR